MNEDPPKPPPLPGQGRPDRPQPPPAPLPQSFVREGLARLRIPGLIVLLAVAAQLIVYLVAAAYGIGITVLMAANPPPSGDQIPMMVWFGGGAAFNLISIIALGVIAYGGVRMMRAHGYNWAVSGAIVQVVWGIVHGMLQFYAAPGIGCVLAPIEVAIAITAGSIALVVLSDGRVHTTFGAVERHPELLSESAADG